MPSINLRNPLRRDPNRPTLKQRAAALKATAARLIRKPKNVPSADARNPVQNAAGADPRLVAMVAEWQETRRKLNDPAFPEGPEADAMGEEHSLRQREIYLYPARSALDLLTKVPVLRDEMRDAICASGPITSSLPGAAWTGLLTDIERIAGATTTQADDAELIALAGSWEAASRFYDRRMEEQVALSKAAAPGPGAAPTGAGADWQEWRRRCDEWREQTGIADAEDASGDACLALGEIEDQIAALPARTLAGLQIKARVAERNSSIDVEWPRGLGDGLVADLLSLTGSLRAGPAGPQIAPTTDAELIALGHAFDAATVRDREANDALTAAEDRAEPHMPERPAALFLRVEDAPFCLRKLHCHPEALQGQPVTSNDIEWMTRCPAQHEVWIDAPPGSKGWNMMPGKVPQIVPWPEAQARIDEIFAAWAAWEEEKRRVMDEAGVFDARDTTDKTSDAAAALARQIAAQPAHTVEGMRAKLRVAAFYCVCDPGTPEGEGYPGEAAIRSLYRDTPGIEISTNPSDIRIEPEA